MTTETSITLAWRRSEKVGVSSLKRYTIEYYSSDLHSGWVLAAHRVLAEKYTIQALRPDSRCVFIVRAENSHGLGVPSPLSEPIRTLGGPLRVTMMVTSVVNMVSYTAPIPMAPIRALLRGVALTMRTRPASRKDDRQRRAVRACSNSSTTCSRSGRRTASDPLNLSSMSPFP
ncbi:hypothetical protein HPB49_016906 [Dermacentor silvarum]|uniref:Uncharacterized protein n=1 Tax=Dermacentor silvarum TaxID=543639 RepID=A0ACB8CLU3_DERSI|nr:hypothetical protein HPB49_016906 [Dermacentor silvarum]